MVGDVVDWHALGLVAPENATQMLPFVIRYLTPSVIAVLGLAVIAAAVMSSVDASMLSASSLFSWNIYHRVFKPTATPAEISTVIKKSVLVVGVAATILAIKYESVYALWVLCSDFVYCILFPQLVCALFDPKANKTGALWGMAVAVFLRFGGGEPALNLPTLLPYPMIDDGVVLFPFRTVAMLCSLLTIIFVSRMVRHSASDKSLAS
jgi:solute carrier family 5 (high affinity choline transporter), member 7